MNNKNFRKLIKSIKQAGSIHRQMSKEIKLDIWPSYNIKHRLFDPQKDLYEAVEAAAEEAASGFYFGYYFKLQEVDRLVEDYYGHSEIEQLNYTHRVCMMGAEKYGLGMYLTHKFSFKDRINSALRHIVKSQKEELDGESGLPHLYHTLANVYMIGEILLTEDKEKIKESNDITFLLGKEEKVTNVFEAMGLKGPSLEDLEPLKQYYDKRREEYEKLVTFSEDEPKLELLGNNTGDN